LDLLRQRGNSLYFYLLVLELLRQRGIFSIGFVAVATAQKYKNYHAVAPVPKTNKKSTKNATLSQQLQNQ
jgi:hypothetical protein